MKKLLSLTGSLILLAGCAHNPSVPLNQAFWDDHHSKVKVAANYPATAKFLSGGDQGVLDKLLTSGANKSLEKRLKNYKLNNFSKVKAEFKVALKKRGIKATVLPGDFELERLAWFAKNDGVHFARHNYMPLAARLNADEMLLLSINDAGIERDYAGFIPHGPARAVVNAEGRLVNLHNNRIKWRYYAHVRLPVEGKWDQPPHFPNAIHTLNLAMKLARQQLLGAFTQS